MRTHSFATLCLSLGLGACCLTPHSVPTPSTVETPPITPPPIAMVGGPLGSGAPGCPDLRTAIVGTFSREGVVEEYHADGTYVLNGLAGTIEWLRPGHAMIDVPGASFHMEYDIALADAVTLVSSDPNHIGAVAARTTAAPAIPASCFDLGAAWVGTWTPAGGGPNEQYNTDGSYAAPGLGQWTLPTPGHLHLVNVNGSASDYLLGMATPTTALAVSLPPLAPMGVPYTRAQ